MKQTLNAEVLRDALAKGQKMIDACLVDSNRMKKKVEEVYEDTKAEFFRSLSEKDAGIIASLDSLNEMQAELKKASEKYIEEFEHNQRGIL